MKNKKKIIALIPARGGSKGLPRKNILLLQGKPLIAWTIEQAHNSRYVDRVIVSTDDREIAGIARQYKAEVPFLRPATLAGDKAKTTNVAVHALQWLNNSNDVYDILVLLQPTSPLRQAEDIDQAIEVFFQKKAQAVVSVCQAEHHPAWANQLPADGCMKGFLAKKVAKQNRQALPSYYRLNGAVYVADTDHLIKQQSFFGPKTYAYIMPAARSVDIDNQLDLGWAEFLLTVKGKI